MNELIMLINEIHEEQKRSGINAEFPRVVELASFDLEAFNSQTSDYTGVDTEYVSQTGDSERGYVGEMVVPIGDMAIAWYYSG